MKSNPGRSVLAMRLLAGILFLQSFLLMGVGVFIGWIVADLVIQMYAIQTDYQQYFRIAISLAIGLLCWIPAAASAEIILWMIRIEDRLNEILEVNRGK
jgi:NhaP-type Na+/H+ or K+/H+ antiporter